MFEIFIRIPERKQLLVLWVEVENRVCTLRVQIEGAAKYKMAGMRLNYLVDMEDHNTLGFYKIRKNAHLNVLGKIGGGAKARPQKSVVKLTDAQRVDNLMCKFRRIHQPVIDNQEISNIVSIMSKAEELYTELSNNSSFLEDRLKKMNMEQLAHINNLAGGTQGNGGSERKLPPIIHYLLPEITALADGVDVLQNVSTRMLEAGLGHFIKIFFKIRPNSDEVLLPNFILKGSKTKQTSGVPGSVFRGLPGTPEVSPRNHPNCTGIRHFWFTLPETPEVSPNTSRNPGSQSYFWTGGH